MRVAEMTIAIDETGRFEQAKLRAATGRASGLVAVISTHSHPAVERLLRGIADRHRLKYPTMLHRMDLHHTAPAALEELLARAPEVIDAWVGVHGTVRGRIYFHEQEAYGEALLALLEVVWKEHSQKIRAMDRIELKVGSRKQEQLVGYADPDQYHRRLESLLTHACSQAGWPKALQVTTRDATRDPHLILADMYAGASLTAPWSRDLADIGSPSTRRVMAMTLGKATPIGSVLVDISAGKTPGTRVFDDLPEQSRHEALSQMVLLAQANVRDRGASGDMDVAGQLLEVAWRIADKGSAGSVKSDICLLAAEVCSHQGFTEAAPEVIQWRQRADALGSQLWGGNLLERQARRLAHRCQTVQIVDFNVFDFESAYLEFDEERAQYEARADGAENLVADELYGKILGTLGQACGFLRPQDPALGAEAWNYLERSAPCFEASEPLFRAMSIGFRITDLWDRGELDACEALANSALPRVDHADPYTLLHRLRLEAAKASSGAPAKARSELIERLLSILKASHAAGKTPFDMCLKWALYLEPDNSALRTAAEEWASALDPTQIAILATSLPLLGQLGQLDQAARHLEKLLAYPGFRAHWGTARARPLAVAIAECSPVTYEALRAMPWNYG